MKIFAISDLHLSFTADKPMDVFGEIWEGHFDKIVENWNSRVTEDDVVVVAGDLSWAMTLENAKIDLSHLADLKGRIVVVKGNHDYWWSSLKKVTEAVPQNVVCIQNNAIKIGNYIFCGTRGWTVAEKGRELSPEDQKIFLREIIRLQLSLKEAAKMRKEGDKLIVVMHYPPFNTLAADSEFTQAIAEAKADAVIYGHLHGKKKGVRLEWTKDGISYYLTSCDMLGNVLKEIF